MYLHAEFSVDRKKREYKRKKKELLGLPSLGKVERRCLGRKCDERM